MNAFQRNVLRALLAITPEEKLQLDVPDFWGNHKGLETYLGLGPKGTLE
jgi:hypothetical protein